MIDAVTGGQEVTRAEQPRLYNLLENLCISRGIPMPKLKVMDSSALNAFATGMNEKQYSITVTSGLLASLDDAEIEAVLGHELTHIRNGDVRMMVIAVVIAGVVGFFAELFFRLFFNWGGGFRSSRSSSSDSDGKGKGGFMIAIIIAVVLIALAWALSLLIRLALSRRREFLADAGSVELTKNPDAMISALRKIENRGELQGATSAVMEMCLDNPREGLRRSVRDAPVGRQARRCACEVRGRHDPGPLAVPQFDKRRAGTGRIGRRRRGATAAAAGRRAGQAVPAGSSAARPPIEFGAPSPAAPTPSAEPGPWGPHGGSR